MFGVQHHLEIAEVGLDVAEQIHELNVIRSLISKEGDHELGGGGLRSGIVIGETEPTEEPKSPADPIEVHDLFATILNQLGVEFDKEVLTPIGRPMKFRAGKPIEKLQA